MPVLGCFTNGWRELWSSLLFIMKIFYLLHFFMTTCHTFSICYSIFLVCLWSEIKHIPVSFSGSNVENFFPGSAENSWLRVPNPDHQLTLCKRSYFCDSGQSLRSDLGGYRGGQYATALHSQECRVLRSRLTKKFLPSSQKYGLAIRDQRSRIRVP